MTKIPLLYVVIGSQYGVSHRGNAGHYLSTVPPHTPHFSAGWWVVWWVGGEILSMLAMEMPFFGHLSGVGGRWRAIGSITPQNTTRRPRSPPLAGCGLVGWWRGSAMQAMREKKPQAMGAMGGGEGANPPQNRTTAPLHRARCTPAILAGAGGGWVVAGGPDRLAVPRFGQTFFRLRAQFFFFSAKPDPLTAYARRIFSRFFF